MSLRRSCGTATAMVVAMTALASAASAATVMITGADGNPTPLSPGLVVANISPSLQPGFTPDEARYSLYALDASGSLASPEHKCEATAYASPTAVQYRGNGAYAAVLRTFAAKDTSCTSPLQDERVDFTIAGATAIAAPSPVLLLRQPNADSTTGYDLPVTPVAGAGGYEVRSALGGVTGADGAFTGPSEVAQVSSATGRAAVSFRWPGRYTFIARAYTSYARAFTPWSRPLSVTVRAPFDVLAYTLRFTDDTGPSFRLEGQVREPSARGNVSFAAAHGKRGTYRSLGYARLTPTATFAKRFRLRPGSYRLRISFRGSATVARGSLVQIVRVGRRIAVG
jgi:hypothetical protein